MSAETDRIEELERQSIELLGEVDRFRTASEDALQQLDWCIGYFTGCGKSKIAKALGANRAQIRKNLRRSEQATPTSTSNDS
jgi:hypothetical protein